MTRPQIQIDWDLVDYMLEYGADGTTIAAKLAMHPQTLYDRVYETFKIGFTEYAQQKRSVGDNTLREAQYKKATKKLDNTMLVWLGKQRLGQSDHPKEKNISEEVIKAFNELMAQLAQVQTGRKAQLEPGAESKLAASIHTPSSGSASDEVNSSVAVKDGSKASPMTDSLSSISSVTQARRESPFA